MFELLLLASGVVGFAVGGAPAIAAPQDEPSCVLDTLPSPARQSLVEVVAEADRASTEAALQENAPAIRDAALSCSQQFDWSQEERQTAMLAFLYDFRFEASLIRLRAQGLTLEAASEMFEALPATMHEAIFARRPMTGDELAILQAAFERLVEQLDGPDGNALSEYITARAGYEYYARELLSR